MKLFLKNIALFCLTTIVIAFVLQLGLSVRISNKPVTGYDNWDSLSNQKADLILLGSSRCWGHFNPAFFEKKYNVKTLNLGMNGHSELTAIRLRLENYLAKNPTPKFALLSFDPFVQPGDLKNTNFTDKDKYARFAFFPSDENLPLVDYFQFSNTEKYVPLYAIFKYRLLKDCLLLDKTNTFPKGYGENTDQWDTIKHPLSDEVKKFFIKDEDYPKLKKELTALYKFCQQKNIKLLCIQTPICKTLTHHKKFKESVALCKSLGIPLIDANYPEISAEVGFFYNSNHLNLKGVNQMNKLLYEEKELKHFFKINP
jgi:hypothetical protein